MLTALKARCYNANSRNIFPVSMEGCVLYLPLGQEDMQGSTLISYDQYHHTCTVTGAVWTPQGRTFAGTPDKISVPDTAVLDSTNILTIMGWVKPGTQTTAYAAMVSKQNHTGEANKGYYIDRNNVDASSYRFGFGTGAAYVVATNLLVMTNAAWNFFAATKTGTTVVTTVIVGGVTTTNTETVASATIATNTANLQLGDWPDSGASRRYWIGTWGEIWESTSKALAAGEVMQYKQATAWRYS